MPDSFMTGIDNRNTQHFIKNQCLFLFHQFTDFFRPFTRNILFTALTALCHWNSFKDNKAAI